MLITVFTPTYNRAHLLPRLYESLCKQTFKDFEWVIVDDGSTDETREVVENFNFNANVNNDRHHENFNLNVNGNNDRRPLAPSNLEGELKIGNENENSNFNVNLNFNKGDDSNDKQINPHNLCNPCEIPEKSFPIRYIYKANGGKHTAINVGVKEAKGEFFLILDSDDSLPEDSLIKIIYHLEQIKDNKEFAGVAGFMAHRDGTVISRGYNESILDSNSLDFRYRYKIKGDLLEIFRTSVMQEFPFPEIEKERFCPEALIWNRIATKYKLRLFDEVVYYRDYLDGGLTDNIIRIRMNSPIASMMTYAEMTRYSNVPFLQKMKAAINYWRFRFCYNRNDNETIKDTIWNKAPTINWYWIIAIPIGYAMHRRDINVNGNGN